MFRDGSAFVLSWDDVCTIFEGVYLNWDPDLFSHRLQFHGWSTIFLHPVCNRSLSFLSMWKARHAKDKELCKQNVFLLYPNAHLCGGILTATNRHLRLNTSNADTVWVLLTRHQVSTHRRSDYVALHVSEDQDHRMDTSKIVATVSAW